MLIEADRYAVQVVLERLKYMVSACGTIPISAYDCAVDMACANSSLKVI